MLIRALIIAVAGTTSGGMAAAAVDANCADELPRSSTAASATSFDDLVTFHVERSPAWLRDAAREAAGRTEDSLASGAEIALQDLFYGHLLASMSAACSPGSDADRETGASGLVEKWDRWLLSENGVDDTEAILPPRYSVNLSGRANAVLAAAACHPDATPRLAAGLAELGVRCSGSAP